MTDNAERISIVVVGGSGDLARKKIFPALFALYCQGHLPREFNVFSYARSRFSPEAFRAHIAGHLTCRYAPGESCEQRMSEFLARCHHVSGPYGEAGGYLDLYQAMRAAEAAAPTPRLFYLAIPPSVFLDVARTIGNSGLVACGHDGPWSRVVIEKPFGRDRASSDDLTRGMGAVFTEDQTFRIDHYLAKEVIQNLMVLRFANAVFEPIWNRRYIRNVLIRWQEDIGVEGRGGYFDAFGIIRDVMQNHLLQILSLVAMEPPSTIDSRTIRDRKVDVLRAIRPPGLDDLVIGQYAGARRGDARWPAYTDDPEVPPDSVTPTAAAALLEVNTERWKGVPFLVYAGKATNARLTEIRIRFRALANNIFCALGECPEPNELVIRVQPDEAINLRIVSKVPGLGMTLQSRNLDLRYKAAFSEPIPDAYESLLLDVMRGEKSLFIRGDELAAAWDVFTPVLHELERVRVRPEAYEFGSGGPAGAMALAARHGVDWI